MRALLAVLDHVATAPAVLAAAGLVAQRLAQPRIDVLHVRPAVDPSFMPTEEVMTPEREARFDAREAAHSAALQQIFAAWQRAAGPVGSAWRVEIGDEAAVVVREGEKSDLIVIGRSPHREPGDGKATVEAALFAGCAPVLLVPETVRAPLGSHIAVAWKRGDTTERAIVAATPLLRAADQVTVLVGASPADDLLPDVLAHVLAGREPRPAMHPFDPASQAIGTALLSEARRVGADLLVMGAYAHHRSLEMLIGGATREILAAGDLPVLLHH